MQNELCAVCARLFTSPGPTLLDFARHTFFSSGTRFRLINRLVSSSRLCYMKALIYVFVDRKENSTMQNIRLATKLFGFFCRPARSTRASCSFAPSLLYILFTWSFFYVLFTHNALRESARCLCWSHFFFLISPPRLFFCPFSSSDLFQQSFSNDLPQ